MRRGCKWATINHSVSSGLMRHASGGGFQWVNAVRVPHFSLSKWVQCQEYQYDWCWIIPRWCRCCCTLLKKKRCESGVSELWPNYGQPATTDDATAESTSQLVNAASTQNHSDPMTHCTSVPAIATHRWHRSARCFIWLLTSLSPVPFLTTKLNQSQIDGRTFPTFPSSYWQSLFVQIDVTMIRSTKSIGSTTILAMKGCFIWLDLDDNQNRSNAPGANVITVSIYL